MAGARGKKDTAYSALRRLMEEPGSDDVILGDFLASIEEADPKKRVARALLGGPQFDDRGVAVIFGALAENALESAISTHFAISSDEARKLFSYTDDGRLAHFNAKIAMGYALGIYDSRMSGDLKWIARVRNAFAHARIQVGFHTEAIIEACQQLKFPSRDATLPKTARQRFTLCAGMSVLHLRNHKAPQKGTEVATYRAMYERKAE